jgi:hypothetical protein
MYDLALWQRVLRWWSSGLCCRVVLQLVNVSEKSAGSVFEIEMMKVNTAGSCSGRPTYVQSLYWLRQRSDISRQRKMKLQVWSCTVFSNSPRIRVEGLRKTGTIAVTIFDLQVQIRVPYYPPTVSTTRARTTRSGCILNSKHHYCVDVQS